MLKTYLRKVAQGLALCALLSLALTGHADAQHARDSANASVAITAGNTYQTILTYSFNRNSLTIENNNTNGDNCWIEVTGLVQSGDTTATTRTPPGGSALAASKISILLTPSGGSYTRYFPYLPSAAIVATCAADGDTLYVDTQ